jgi:signal transduction histidine kinase
MEASKAAPSTSQLWAGAVATVALTVIAAALALSGDGDHRGLVAVAKASIVGLPMAVGLYAWRRGAEARFGRLLIAAGVAWFVSTLAESGDDLVYTIGRTAGWLVEVLLVYLILAFPSGRLPERTDRVLAAAMGAVVLVLYLPRLLLVEDFEVPSPFTSCVEDCPANAFFPLEREPQFVDAVMRPLGVVLVFAVMTAVTVRLWARTRAASPLTRRMLVPVVAVGATRAGLLGIAIVARQLDSTAKALEVTSWLLALAIPAMALAFLAGLLRWRLFGENALRRLAECVRTMPDAVTLRTAFAEAFHDPTVEIVYPDREPVGGWLDSGGHPVELPEPGGGRGVSEVRDRGNLIAAIVHDEGLGARPELVDAGVAMAGIVLDNQRLAAQAEASLREVERSRARIASGAARERRRLERDLHDGAQQRLVALRIELGLAGDLLRQDPERGLARLEELEQELDEALDELRSLAHGVYPPLLADRGLVDALQVAATRSTLPVDLEARGVARYAVEVETAVYFCVLEALQNVLKHATGARRVAIRLDGSTGNELRFGVEDDGAGCHEDELHAGDGITGMRDRLAAVGGELSVASVPGAGTTVSGVAPAVQAQR